VPADRIVVLSNRPTETAKKFGVPSSDRWQPFNLIKLLLRARLFISGGGGLFQDTVSVRSPIFYGTQLILAKVLGAPSMIYAQGVGPLKTFTGKQFAHAAFSSCRWITVRDQASADFLAAWKIKAQLTADPVWQLLTKPLPPELEDQLEAARLSGSELIGLSLRVSNNFAEDNVDVLAQSLHRALPEKAVVVPIVMQHDLDALILQRFVSAWRSHGRQEVELETRAIEKPSQWASLMAQFDMVVGMRLHASIMALKAGVPCVCITYDPKVASVAGEFGMPTLNLTKDGKPNGGPEAWTETLKSATGNKDSLSRMAQAGAQTARNMACQNFNLLARILDMQSDSE
jgi:polysaccharide pyruvyl transferase CsaB